MDIEIVIYPVLRYKAKKTQSACELVTSAAGSNIYTLIEIKDYNNFTNYSN
jgi:hypothetical protein